MISFIWNEMPSSFFPSVTSSSLKLPLFIRTIENILFVPLKHYRTSLFISNTFKRGLIGDGALIWEGGLFNLAHTMVSVHNKELVRMQSGKAQVQGHAVEDEKQIKTSSWWINHRQSTRNYSFTVVIDCYSLSISFINKLEEEGGEGGVKERGELIDFPPRKRKSLWERGKVFERGGLIEDLRYLNCLRAVFPFSIYIKRHTALEES